MGIVPKLKEEYLISNSDIYVTQSAYDVKNRLLSAKEELRILYDFEEDIYLVCNAVMYTHWEAVKYAMEDGYFSEYDSVDDYSDNGPWETWKFYPSNIDIIPLGYDFYSWEIKYPFGTILAREDDWYDYYLFYDVLGWTDEIYEWDYRNKERRLVPTEESLKEAKSDIDSFVNKFGESTYNNFLKAKDRLKNKGYSTDFTWYVKNMEKKELDDLIISLYDKETDQQKKRMLQGTDKEIRGKYNYLGEKNGYKVYQPLDVQASMDLGVNTGWCTTGRYGHYGHPEFTPSLEDAEDHWNDYTNQGIIFYYFLDSDTYYGKYAVAVYPKAHEINKFIDENTYLQKVNFEIFNAEDDLDYSIADKLPLDLIDKKLIVNKKVTPYNNLIVKGGKIIAINGDAKSIIVPDGVIILDNTISKSKCDSLTSITIPNSVVYIGEGAFRHCKSLTSVTLPESVAFIGEEAFKDCKSLKSIILSNGLSVIGANTFEDCISLTSIKIPNGVKKIEKGAFDNCVSLTNVTFPDSLKIIGKFAFYNCKSLTNITIPDSVTSIENFAFEDCTSLANIVIPDSVTSIGKGAISNCKSLKSITIPSSVTRIEEYEFYGCTSLTNIIIPDGVTSIEECAFSECTSLTSVKIPSSVTSIGYKTFENCTSLTSITVPDSVTDMALYAFYNCPNLTIFTNNKYVKDICGKKYKYAPLNENMNEEVNDVNKFEFKEKDLNESILTNNIYITDNPRRVRDLLYRTTEPIRILYDINSHIYMMGDANEYVHRDLINKAIDDGWYGNELKRWEVDNYVYDTYDEDDNLVQNVVYIVFTPKGNNDTVGGEIGSDGYFDSYDYDIGSILTRDDYDNYWEKTELSKLLGERKQHRFKSGWDENNMPIIQTESRKLVEDIPAVMKNYPKIPEDIFYQIIKLDPTYKDGSNSVGTYGKWLLNLFNKKVLKKEDFYKVPGYLKDFEKKKKWMTNKDIGQFKSLGDLAQALENTQVGELSQNQKDKQFKKEVKNADLNADLVYEDDKWEVWTPNDYESSCKIATNTQWCTGPSSHGNDYYYNHYTKMGPLYIIINKNNNDEKYQFHFPSGQYMDRYDRGIDKDSFLKKNEGIKKYFDAEQERAKEILRQKIGNSLKEIQEKFNKGEITNQEYLNLAFDYLSELLDGDDIRPILTDAYEEYFSIALPPVNDYVILVDKDNIAEKYTHSYRRVDMSEDFIKSCFGGDLWDYWYEGDADADVDSSLLDEYSESTLKKLGFPENIYELMEKDEVPEEFEEDVDELNDCFRFASQEAATNGAIAEAMRDFYSSMNDAVEKVLNNTDAKWEITDRGVEITVLPFSSIVYCQDAISDAFYYYSDYFVSAIDYAFADRIADELRFYEPQYGWYGFDENSFNDRLQELLYDSFGDREETEESLKEDLAPKGNIEDKKILDLIWECINTINEKTGFGIKDDIEFKWGDSTRTLGTMTVAFYKGFPYTLTLNKKVFSLNEEEIKNIIYHELCHYIVFKQLLRQGVWLYDDVGRLCQDNKKYKSSIHGGHGSLWKDTAKAIGNYTGQELTRLANVDIEDTDDTEKDRNVYKYEVVCKNCGCTMKYQKKTEFVKNPNVKSEFSGRCKWCCGRCKASGQFEVHEL